MRTFKKNTGVIINDPTEEMKSYLTLEKVFNPLQINLRLLWRGGPMSIPPILFCLKNPKPCVTVIGRNIIKKYNFINKL